MARLYSNENFPQPAVERLRELGHDVLTTHDAGKSNRAIPDSEVLDFSKALGRAVVTFNRRDFIRLHSEAPDHAGIIVCSFNRDFADLAARVDAALGTSGSLDGQLVQVRRGVDGSVRAPASAAVMSGH
ncbi:MAG: DUF5615 family PIN-like protein [Pseudomonadota bacterium]